MAVAVFDTPKIQGEVLFTQDHNDIVVHALFTKLPSGQHGFHIHTAGDLRGIGCQGACDHFHVGPKQSHGGPPAMPGPRHTGDLGNIQGPEFEANYTLKNLKMQELWGRSVIVHEDPDDLGQGPFDDSTTTGHSGRRIGCAIIGRVKPCAQAPKGKTRKHRHATA
jgi:Cu-Zn family superoxide dismutase